jgi:hypothetical protein
MRRLVLAIAIVPTAIVGSMAADLALDPSGGADAKQPRLVAARVQSGQSCAGAVWPEIPMHCLERVRAPQPRTILISMKD